MTQHHGWRKLSSEETETITAIVSSSGLPDADRLLGDLNGALASPSSSTRWIINIKTPSNVGGIDVSNGPLPVRAFVPNEAEYRGEIIIWVESGHISGLEYVWITDDAPRRWPRPDEMEII